MKKTLFFVFCLILIASACKKVDRHIYSWEKPHAKVLDNGDLQWQPETFKFVKGKSLRYIDFENGDDNNDGLRKSTPWKHHPWDPSATGVSVETKGIYTYVFKRGVEYRGVLIAKESGETGNPIRLTSDPSWGEGEAGIYGSLKISSGWIKADSITAPDIPEPEKVWFRDLPENMFSTKMVCERTSEGIKRVRLARSPNYKESPDNLMKYWYTWTKKEYDEANKKLWLSDSEHLTQSDPAYYKNTTVWSVEDAVNMGALWRQKIMEYDPSKNRIAVENRNFGGERCYYYMENNPAFLDTTSEFYFNDSTKRMFIRLDKDKDPNTTIVEVAKTDKLIIIENQHDIVISGLTFGYTTSDTVRLVAREGIGAIQLSGTCYNIEVRNNKFTHVVGALAAQNPSEQELSGHDIIVSDNDMQIIDDMAISFSPGRRIFFDRVRIMRNRIYDNGGRHLSRWASPIPAVYAYLIDGEVAGNIVDVSWGSAINIFWGKTQFDNVTFLPFIRGLIHHNKASNTLIGTHDYGGIESWQGGPVYCYNNISHNAWGYRPKTNDSQGYNFYFDGSFKHYVFNNIATGLSWKQSRSGYMTVLGFYNMTVHNTGYMLNSLTHGAVDDQHESNGHNAYLANLADSVRFIFKNSLKPFQVPFESYGYNVFSNAPFKGSFITEKELEKGFWGDGNLVDLATFKKNLESFKPQLAQVGIEVEESVLPNAQKGDYRPVSGSPAIDGGVKFFASFPLYANVGEWNFYKHPADPGVIMADNFYMTNEYGNRFLYYQVPENNLKTHGVTLNSFEKGLLEDWTEGALRFDGDGTWCELDHEIVSKKVCTNVDMTTDNFLIEIIFRTDKGHTEGVLVSKYEPAGNGYRLDIDKKGKPRLSLMIAGKAAYTLTGKRAINDGKWHHVLAEVDRSGKINMFTDGAISNGSSYGETLSHELSLGNSANFLVGRDPEGNFFKGTLDFLRLAKGTLKESRTTIEELYKWEFDGPFLRDFTGIKPIGRRDVGAIEVE